MIHTLNVEIMICFDDHTWTTETAETTIPEADLDEQNLLSLLPEGYRGPGRSPIASVSIHHIEAGEEREETHEEGFSGVVG